MGKTAIATARAAGISATKPALKIASPAPKKAAPAQPLVLRSQSVVCTPATARQLRAACHYERQRALSERHIARLAEEMKRGSFIPGTQVFLGVLPDRSMLILNGNHTLEAVATSGVPTPLTFTFCPIKDLVEAGRLYAQFDIHRTRSWGDAYKAYGFDENIPAEWINRSGSAIGVIALGFRRSDHSAVALSREIRSQMMREYSETIQHFIAAVRGSAAGTAMLVKRRAVLAVALETMRWQPSAAAEFWGKLVRDDGLRSGDPAKTLLNYLRNFSAGDGGTTGIIQANAAALAWNAFYTKKPIQVLRARDSVFSLAGTPWVDASYKPDLPDADQSHRVAVKIDTDSKTPFSTGKSYSKDGDKVVVLYGDAA